MIGFVYYALFVELAIKNNNTSIYLRDDLGVGTNVKSLPCLWSGTHFCLLAIVFTGECAARYFFKSIIRF